MNTYHVSTNHGTFAVQAWSEGKAIWAVQGEGYQVISITQVS